MLRSRVTLGLLLCLVAAANVPVRSADLILVGAGSAWRYNDSGTNLGTAWRARPTTMPRGRRGSAQLGYGDGDESTVLSYGSNPSNRRITYYFRRAFTVATPGGNRGADRSATSATTGASSISTASKSSGPTCRRHGDLYDAGDGSHRRRRRERVASRPPSTRRCSSPAPTSIAVEMHQQSPSSTDISFDLELRATEARRRRRRRT